MIDKYKNGEHKELAKQRSKEWYWNNRDRALARNKAYRERLGNRQLDLRAKYKMSLKDYDIKFAAQGGVCAICKKPESAVIAGKKCSLSVDHNRKCCSKTTSCGECIRGLLCTQCNTAIGKFYDSIELLESAIKYLRGYSCGQ